MHKHLNDTPILNKLLIKRKNFGFLQLSVKGRKEMFYLTMHSTHFIYGYMASVIW